MIAVFLQQEYAHRNRYGERIDACLGEEGVDASRITEPNLDDPIANDDRRRVFARYRGYGAGQPSYLTDFPDTGVKWNLVALTPGELLDSRFIRYAYWTDLSGGTRLPKIAAERIRAGIGVEGQPHQHFLDLAKKLRQGLKVPTMILVSADNGKTRVVLEGHSRITAFALAPDAIPDETEVMLGTSPDVARWDEY